MAKVSPEKAREYQAKYKSKPGVKEKYRQLNKEWIDKNRPQYNKAKSIYRFRLKIDALKHYSNGTLSCARCGFNSDVDGLCLDHINDDGAEHRRSLGIAGRNAVGSTTIYERLRALGWQEGLQVLCHNCNAIKELRRKRGGASSDELMKAINEPIRWSKT